VRRKLLTENVLAQIPLWLGEDGLGPVDIAKKIGCTVGSLRVLCSRYGISLRRRSTAQGIRDDNKQPYALRRRSVAEKLVLALPLDVRDRVQRRAAVSGMSEPEFLSVLIETIDRDDLYGAVLDNGK